MAPAAPTQAIALFWLLVALMLVLVLEVPLASAFRTQFAPAVSLPHRYQFCATKSPSVASTPARGISTDGKSRLIFWLELNAAPPNRDLPNSTGSSKGFASKVTISGQDQLVNCPCGSGQVYQHCCFPYHSGQNYPSNITALVRSRYSAYALKPNPLASYIMETTHSSHREYIAADRAAKRKAWGKQIRDFGVNNDFLSLEFIGSGSTDTVTADNAADSTTISFRVTYRRRRSVGVPADASEPASCFVEKSVFKRENGVQAAPQWKYADGILS